MLSFDYILDTKIGSGWYQYRTFSVLGLIDFCDGIEYAFMSILMTILKKEWALSVAEIASLGAFYQLGMVIGSILCAYATDVIGRKRTFIIFCGLSSLCVYGISFTRRIEEILLLRLLFGIVFGVTYPLAYIYMSEVSISKNRGRMSFGLGLMFVLGKIYLVLLCFYFLNDFESGNWRGLIRFNGIPVVISFIGATLWLNETVRYYLNKGKFCQTFEQINKMIEMNGREQIDEQEKDGLICWQFKQNKLFQLDNNSQKGLLHKSFRLRTILLWFLTGLINFQSMSTFLLMPFLFAKQNSSFGSMLILFVIEFFFAIFAYQFIDNPQYGGRKKILIYSIIIIILTTFSLFIFEEQILFFGMLAIKLCTRALFSTIYLMTCESYPLHLRSEGCGIAQGFGKIITVPSAYILFPLFYISAYLPFLLMCILGIIMLILAIIYPTDKTQQKLEE